MIDILSGANFGLYVREVKRNEIERVIRMLSWEKDKAGIMFSRLRNGEEVLKCMDIGGDETEG